MTDNPLIDLGEQIKRDLPSLRAAVEKCRVAIADGVDAGLTPHDLLFLMGSGMLALVILKYDAMHAAAGSN